MREGTFQPDPLDQATIPPLGMSEIAVAGSFAFVQPEPARDARPRRSPRVGKRGPNDHGAPGPVSCPRSEFHAFPGAAVPPVSRCDCHPFPRPQSQVSADTFGTVIKAN